LNGISRRPSSGVDRLRLLALQAQDHRLVAAVADAGGAERAEQLGLDRHHRLKLARRLEPLRKQPRRAHGPHRVRGGRADADLEQVKDADRHHATFWADTPP
jgi:hypothetical protein